MRLSGVPVRFFMFSLLLLALFPAVASAAPVSLEDSKIFVQLWPEGEPGTSVLIVGVVLPPDTQLPATVRLPLPDDAQVFWAGEVMGEDPAGDVSRPTTIVAGEGGRALEFTAETTLSVQYDATYKTILTNGSELKTTLDWIQTVPSSGVSFAIRMPALTEVIELDPEAPGEPQENAFGERLYTLSDAVLATGDQYPVTVTYTREGMQSDTGQGGSTVLIVLGVAFAVAVAALFAAISAQKRRVAAEDDDTDS